MGGLTWERDSRGSREQRVCLFLLWASRSTNITDHEQPCGAKHINTYKDIIPDTADLFTFHRYNNNRVSTLFLFFLVLREHPQKCTSRCTTNPPTFIRKNRQ